MSVANLKTSDLVSGVICVTYDSLTGIPSNKMTRFTEQVAHRVIGRSANQLTNLPPLEFVVSENDIYTAGVAGLDSTFRKGYLLGDAGFDALRAGLSSFLADWVHQTLGITDNVLISV